METFFLGLLRRLPSGDLKFQVDAYSRERRTIGPEAAGRMTDAWLKATRGDQAALSAILHDPFALLSPIIPQ